MSWLISQGPSSGQVRVLLRDVAEAAGIRFVHRALPSPAKYYVDSVPGGLAIFDDNGDGRPDLFFTNGARMPSLEKQGAADSNRLYRNDGNMRFTDVTDAAGVAGVGYAMGAATDYDNDGHVDLCVAGTSTVEWAPNGGSSCDTRNSRRGSLSGSCWLESGT